MFYSVITKAVELRQNKNMRKLANTKFRSPHGNVNLYSTCDHFHFAGEVLEPLFIGTVVHKSVSPMKGIETSCRSFRASTDAWSADILRALLVI